MLVTIDGQRKHFRTVSFDESSNSVLLIEQRLLPHAFEIISASTFSETALAIKNMVVRGAGAIGATAAYGFAQGLKAFDGASVDFEEYSQRVYQTIKEARPTAVDPVNAMNRIRGVIAKAHSIPEKQELALQEAHAFAEEDIAHCRAIGEQGSPLITGGKKVLTHCKQSSI